VWRGDALSYLKKIEKSGYRLYDYPHDVFYKQEADGVAAAIHEFIAAI